MLIQKKIIGVKIIALAIFLGNILLIYVGQNFFFQQEVPSLSQLSYAFAIIGVFPLDFFISYLREYAFLHFTWIFLIILSTFGIYFLNRTARKIFILLNIVHVVFLTYIVFLRYGEGIFLEYFFRLYFNIVASGAYIGFLTTLEMQEYFHIKTRQGLSIERMFKSFRKKKNFQPNAGDYYNLGLAYSRLERYKDGIATLEKAIKLDSQNEEYYLQLGIIFMKRKNILVR